MWTVGLFPADYAPIFSPFRHFVTQFFGEKIMKSITLDYDGDDYGLRYDTIICTEGLRKHIFLPRLAPNRLRLTFTAGRVQGEDSFELFSWDGQGRYVHLKDVNNYLLSNFRRILREQWKLGHRFFHFSYSED